MERPLALHDSALSEAEFRAYTSILRDILSENEMGDWDSVNVPVGEMRGWIRGKYGVEGALLAQILRLFPDTAVQGSSLRGTQFLAVLRLISHAQAGRGVEKALVFVQAQEPLGANLTSNQTNQPSPPLPARSTSSATRRQADDAPEPFQSGGRRVSSDDAAPPNASTSLGSNPFRRTISHTPHNYNGSQSYYSSAANSVVGDDDDGRRSPAHTAPLPIATPKAPRTFGSASIANANIGSSGTVRTKKLSTPDEPSRNPFFAKTDISLPMNAPVLPPLPPRKPVQPVLPPPRHPAPPPPPKPVRKPSHTQPSSTSTLIRQSLAAAKSAQKVPESTLQQMKTLMIVKSSSQTPASGGGSAGGTLKERATGVAKSSDSSAATTAAFSTGETTSLSSGSTSSSLDFAPATIRSPFPKPLIRSTTANRPMSPSKLSPTKLSMEEADQILQRTPGTAPPFQTPTPEAMVGGPSRPVRSKSLHGTPSSSSSSRPPVPTPPPRKRPESVQVTTSPFASANPSATSAPLTSATQPPFTLSRRASMQSATSQPPPSRSTRHSPNQSQSATPPHDPFSSFYFAMRGIPKATENLFSPSDFQKLASKAEGGLAPGRGYLSHRGVEGQRLVSEDDDPTVDTGSPGMDDDWSEWDRRPSPPARGDSGNTATITSSSQQRAVQQELDQLRSQRIEPRLWL